MVISAPKQSTSIVVSKIHAETVMSFEKSLYYGQNCTSLSEKFEYKNRQIEIAKRIRLHDPEMRNDPLFSSSLQSK